MSSNPVNPLKNQGGAKTRLDQLLVQRGLAESRERAQRLILAGLVTIAGRTGTKPGDRVAADIELTVTGRERHVSRGGLKLEAALEAFGIRPEGMVCADIGASTGGFTDCLLQAGAARVFAVDVGRSRLHERLQADPRVVLVEQCNARELAPGRLPAAPVLFAVDVSFISLSRILAPLAAVAAPGAQMVALVKPQFEAGRADVSRGRGVIRDPRIHARVLAEVAAAAVAAGWHPLGLIPSPIEGGSGNREFLLHAALDPPASPFDIDAAIARTCNHPGETPRPDQL
jgi:23S rRNA (cytidine1920-2'-O)/16S rRNA (cytidine1409-2'-O)-methyltransferase